MRPIHNFNGTLVNQGKYVFSHVVEFIPRYLYGFMTLKMMRL